MPKRQAVEHYDRVLEALHGISEQIVDIQETLDHMVNKPLVVCSSGDVCDLARTVYSPVYEPVSYGYTLSHGNPLGYHFNREGHLVPAGGTSYYNRTW